MLSRSWTIGSQLKAIQSEACVYMYVPLIVLATVFSMAWYNIVMQHFLMVYHGISHLSLVFSRYTHLAYTTRKSCITSTDSKNLHVRT